MGTITSTFFWFDSLPWRTSTLGATLLKVWLDIVYDWTERYVNHVSVHFWDISHIMIANFMKLVLFQASEQLQKILAYRAWTWGFAVWKRWLSSFHDVELRICTYVVRPLDFVIYLSLYHISSYLLLVLCSAKIFVMPQDFQWRCAVKTWWIVHLSRTDFRCSFAESLSVFIERQQLTPRHSSEKFDDKQVNYLETMECIIITIILISIKVRTASLCEMQWRRTFRR